MTRLRSVAITGLIATASGGGVQAQSLPAMAWGDRAGRAAWTTALLDELGSAPAADLSTPRLEFADLAEFCPGYGRGPPSSRQAFWAGLLSFMATYETNGFNPANDTREKDGTISSGLLQLTVRSDHARCPFLTAATIHDPQANLRCGARLLAHYVVRDGQIAAGSDYKTARGAARYWGPMRDSAKRRATAAWTRAQLYCRIPAP